jgi:hypothetical protein
VEGSCEHGDEPLGSLKLLGISRMAAQLAASQEGLSSVSKYSATIVHLHHKPRRDNFFFIVVGLAVPTASITLINQVTISCLLYSEFYKRMLYLSHM